MTLAPLATLYGAITGARAALYRQGLLNVARLDAPVLSVGNITTGGTGKTPLVEYLARTVAAGGRKVCILTRGYGRENPNSRVLVSDGTTILAGAREAGDEPLLLAENLKGLAAVISDANRLAAGRWAIKELGAEIFILDDGFQHLQLERDLNLVTVDASAPWDNGYLLPRGRLREKRGGLARADCIVITRAEQAGDLESLKHEVERHSNGRPVLTSRMRVRGLRPLGRDSSPTIAGASEDLIGPVAAFCAIGNPRSFLAQLANEGHIPIRVSEFPDHHRYTEVDVGGIIQKAQHAGAKSLITTAKDAVKLRGIPIELPCYVLEIEICIDEESRLREMIHTALSESVRQSTKPHQIQDRGR